MTKIYSEAIAEAKKLKEVAEANAKQAIIDAMTPKIKRIIEMQLTGEEEDYDLGSDISMSDLDLDLEDAPGEVYDEEESEEDEESEYGTEYEMEDPRGMPYQSTDSEVDSSGPLLSDTLARESKIAIAGMVISEGLSIRETENFRNRFNSLVENLSNFEQMLKSLKENSLTKQSILEMYKQKKELVAEANLLLKVVHILSEQYSGNNTTEVVDQIKKIIKEINNMSKKTLDDILYEMDLGSLGLFEADEEEAEDVEADEESAEDEEEPLPLPDEDEEEEADEAEGDADMLEKDDVEDAIKKLMDDLGLGDEADDMEEGKDMDETYEGMDEDMHEDPDEMVEIDEGMLREELARFRRINESRRRRARQQQLKESRDMARHFGGGSASGDPLDANLNAHAANKKLKRALKEEARKNRSLVKNLTEHKNAVSKLRSQLQEMNLFNAKLLYANKLFQNKNISSQKLRSIIESIDSAKSLREVKLLYRTLTESLGSKGSNNLTESAVRRTIGGSSRPTRSSSAQNVNESKEMDRWALLAGLKR